MIIDPPTSEALEFRVRGRVQGVGFRPTVWRIAHELGLAGEVLNDSEGVLVRVRGDRDSVAALLERLKRGLPPLARIDCIESRPYRGELPSEFGIAESTRESAHTQITPDAAVCSACAAELSESKNRRFRYPFTNCTHCGPRLSIITAIPYDRATTTMAAFPMCDDCRAEYRNPEDRRFHAEPIACPACGPTARLVALGGALAPLFASSGAVETAADLIRRGEIVAIKGLGGYHLACDATNPETVARLRQAKHRDSKPFALMARDLDVVRHYCSVGVDEVRELTSFEAPIVLLRADGTEDLPDAIAPGLRTLGFMLPTTPLHLLLLESFAVPLVMTSGNLSDDPTIIDDAEACRSLADIASYAVVHDRRIANRVDDSVVRIMDGKTRALRRARGFAPAPIKLPGGLERSPDLLTMGGELKATFCLLKDGQAILSQHQGDLENVRTFDEYRSSITLYRQLFDHCPSALVVDRHPEYISAKFARVEAQRRGLPLIEVQHHHAHVAACLAENAYPPDTPPVLGIAFDGLGFGDDGTLWGGEVLLADYRGYRRVASLKPVAMPGGSKAVREPWRNLYAHLSSALGWDNFAALCVGQEIYDYFRTKPCALLDAAIAKGINAPPASSCGRLFDAVAAALGLCREWQAYEGDAAARLEALAERALDRGDNDLVYSFAMMRSEDDLLRLDPSPMWRALLDDLAGRISTATIALRFHLGLAQAIVEVARLVALHPAGMARPRTVALSGGSFQNRILFEAVASRLRNAGFDVLSHANVPANDGGLALGQAAVAAARLLEAGAPAKERSRSCV